MTKHETVDPSPASSSDVSLQTDLTNRLSWDPRKSDLLEQVLHGLVDKYTERIIEHQIHPSMLLKLGDIYSRFYHNTFLNRPNWSVERFPEGWASFVKELNERLATQGISVVDTRRAKSAGTWLPDQERKIVRAASIDYHDGRVSKEDALQMLSQEFGITLTARSSQYYFPERASTPSSDSAANEKAELVEKIYNIKESFNLDFSITNCVRGLAFEKFVGVVLRALHPEEKLDAQRCCKIGYRDFSGRSHYAVYPDWVCGEKSWEVKWRNTADNILESAIPQALALGHKVTVVYHDACPDIMFMMEANIRLNDTLESMGLLCEDTAGLRIKDLMEYVPVSDLLAKLPGNHAAHTMIETLNSALLDATCEEMWEWIDALDRISTRSDQLEARLNVLQSAISNKQRFSAQELNQIFGDTNNPEASKREGVDPRILAIIRERDSARDRLLLSVYNEAFGQNESKLTEQYVSALTSLPEPEFQEAVLTVLGQMEKRALERKLKRYDKSPVEQEREVIAAFEAVEKTRVKDLLHDLDKLDDRVADEVEAAMVRIEAMIKNSEWLAKQVPRGAETWRKILKTALPKESQETIRKRISTANNRIKDALDKTRSGLECIISELQALAETTLEKGSRGWNVDPDTHHVHSMITELRSNIEKKIERIEKGSLVCALSKLLERKTGSEANVTPGELDLIRSWCSHMDGSVCITLIDSIECLVNTIDLCAAAVPGLGFQPLQNLSHSLTEHKKEETKSKLLEGLACLAKTSSHIFTHATLGAQHEGLLLSLARSNQTNTIVDTMVSQLRFLQVVRGSNSKDLLLIPSPGDCNHYMREAALIWEPGSMKDALAEAEHRIRDQRATTWICGIQLMKAVLDGNEISEDFLKIPPGGYMQLTVKVKEMNLKRLADAARTSPGAILKVFQDAMIIQDLICIDVWSRRVAQARRISCFDEELALEFLKGCILLVPEPRQSLQEAMAQMTHAAGATDALYQGLI